MKLLLDANLSPRLVEVLSEAGYPTTHVTEVGFAAAADQTIFDFAADGGYVVPRIQPSRCSWPRRSATPSVVLLRQVAKLRAVEHSALLIANLPLILADLASGAVVSLSSSRLTVRLLPIA